MKMKHPTNETNNKQQKKITKKQKQKTKQKQNKIKNANLRFKIIKKATKMHSLSYIFPHSETPKQT